MNKYLYGAACLLGLTAVCWVGFGYIGSNPLALTMTALIGAFYLMGALELRRFHQATTTLELALAAIPEQLSHLGEWLARLHPSLQGAVRLRVEGERVGLPGPAMTPYLVGLLVLLGMLGTFLGMVVTLNGAVLALESTTDLQTIRASLAAPVKGLGLAFGTSVAGVSASAMLGLMSALCRRERHQAAQRLDTGIAKELRVFSLAHQREETFKTLQAQAHLMPEVAGKLQAMMGQMERQSQALNERLLATQEGFYRNAETVYSNLAASVGKSLKESLAESARIAGATIQPVVEATMLGIARETTSLHQKMADTVQMQLDGLATRFDTTVTTVGDVWTASLARHERASETLTTRLEGSLQSFGETFEQRSASLLGSVETAHRALQGELAATVSAAAQETARLHEEVAHTVTMQLDGVSERFGTTVTGVAQTWRDALAHHRQASEGLAAETQKSWAAFAATFEQNAASLLDTVAASHGALQADLASRDGQRLALWTQSLESIAASLRHEWQQAGAQTLGQQEQICKTLEQTARDITAQAGGHAANTIAEIAQLMQAASEAPRAAAEVIAQFRQKLSDSMARDNELLEERSRIMATLNSLLASVQHTSTEQRASIDALVASSAGVLERVGTQFTDKVEVESARMTAMATQITGSAAEVASLGEAFGFAVGLFNESNQSLMTHLQRIEGALGKSLVRSDEQLAYYVAQAREIIDLSIMSQKQIVDDLQQLASRQALLASEAC